jgi:hypothetical protein
VNIAAANAHTYVRAGKQSILTTLTYLAISVIEENVVLLVFCLFQSVLFAVQRYYFIFIEQRLL